MGSVFDTLYQRAGIPHLMRVLGRSVTRYPKGHSGNKRAVTAIWEPDETPTRTALTDGEQTLRSGTLYVPESEECHEEDIWVMDDARFAVMGKPVLNAGLWTVQVQRIDRVSTTRQRNRL